MPKFSAFQDFTAFRFSGKPTHGEKIYRSMISSVEKAFDVTKGSYEETRIYCQAMGLARARYTIERALAQYFPKTTTDLLPRVEYDWSIVPGPKDGILERQNALALAQKLPRGATRENIEAALRTIYGEDFVTLRTVVPSEVVTWPHVPWTGPGVFKKEDSSILPKYLKFVSPVVFTGEVSKVYYEPVISGDPARLAKNDVVCVQVENLSLAEQVKVLTVGSDANGDYFTAEFIHSHDIGASIIFGTVPVWISNQRFDLFVVKAPGSRDLAKWRKMNYAMQRIERTVTSWAVVEPSETDPTKIGPYTLNTSRLGLTTLGSIDIVPTPGGVPSTQSPDPEFVLPLSGSAAGGESVSIHGSGFTGATAATFDGTSGTILSVTDKKIVCTIPAHAAADVDVEVTTPAGSTVLVQGFEYI